MMRTKRTKNILLQNTDAVTVFNFNQCMNFHFWVIIETQTIFSSICNGLLLKILCFMALPLAYSFLPCKRSCRHEILDKKLSKWNWFEWVAGWRVREKESGLLISFSSISLFNGPELLYYYQICFRGLIFMSGSCHFDRASNDKFSVEFLMFVLIIFSDDIKIRSERIPIHSKLSRWVKTFL